LRVVTFKNFHLPQWLMEIDRNLPQWLMEIDPEARVMPLGQIEALIQIFIARQQPRRAQKACRFARVRLRT
jgi:hypothetical protein